MTLSGFEWIVLLFVVDRADGAEAQTEWSGLGERAGMPFACGSIISHQPV